MAVPVYKKVYSGYAFEKNGGVSLVGRAHTLNQCLLETLYYVRKYGLKRYYVELPDGKKRNYQL